MKRQQKPEPAPLTLPDDVEALKALAQKLHADLAQRTEQRDNLSKLCEQLNADLNTIEYDEILKRERAEHDIRIRQQWRSNTSELGAHCSRFLGSLPSSVDTRVFDADDWERIPELKQKLLRVVEELEALRFNGDRMIVDIASRLPVTINQELTHHE